MNKIDPDKDQNIVKSVKCPDKDKVKALFIYIWFKKLKTYHNLHLCIFFSLIHLYIKTQKKKKKSDITLLSF